MGLIKNKFEWESFLSKIDDISDFILETFIEIIIPLMFIPLILFSITIISVLIFCFLKYIQ